MAEKNTLTISRKVKLMVVTHGETDEEKTQERISVKRSLREAMETQNKCYNILVSKVYAATLNGASSDEIKQIYKLGSRTPKEDDPSYSLYDYNEYKYIKGVPTASRIARYAESDMKTAWKAGLKFGKVSLQNRKKDAPLWIIPENIKYRHNYDDYPTFLHHLINESNVELYIDFVTGITFKVVFGNPWKGRNDRLLWQRIFEGQYKIGGSSIQFAKNGKDIMLNLALNIPVIEPEEKLDKNIVCGVDLGMKIPAVCALNNDLRSHQYIGTIEDFLRVRTAMQSERRRISSNLKTGASGGHGRTKKMKALDRIGQREHNFATTYNHMVSKRVIDFALKNHAGVIHLENLKGFGEPDEESETTTAEETTTKKTKKKSKKELEADKKKKIKKEKQKKALRNWSYYQLQQDIIYKASKYGIEVRKINPYHTSQRCSICGSEEPGQRKDQHTFCCANPNCKSHKLYFVAEYNKEIFNADFNAARNIAMSTDYMEDEKKA